MPPPPPPAPPASLGRILPCPSVASVPVSAEAGAKASCTARPPSVGRVRWEPVKARGAGSGSRRPRVRTAGASTLPARARAPFPAPTPGTRPLRPTPPACRPGVDRARVPLVYPVFRRKVGRSLHRRKQRGAVPRGLLKPLGWEGCLPVLAPLVGPSFLTLNQDHERAILEHRGGRRVHRFENETCLLPRGLGSRALLGPRWGQTFRTAQGSPPSARVLPFACRSFILQGAPRSLGSRAQSRGTGDAAPARGGHGPAGHVGACRDRSDPKEKSLWPRPARAGVRGAAGRPRWAPPPPRPARARAAPAPATRETRQGSGVGAGVHPDARTSPLAALRGGGSGPRLLACPRPGPAPPNSRAL